MRYWSQKRVRASSKSGNCYKVEVGRYAPMIGVSFTLVTTSQLITFGLWKRVASTLQPCGQYQMTRHTPTCALPDAVMIIGDRTKSYPM